MLDDKKKKIPQTHYQHNGYKQYEDNDTDYNDQDDFDYSIFDDGDTGFEDFNGDIGGDW
jgi:hypothetical protein